MGRKKGRSRKLITLRNEKLICRWYYWTEVQRLRFDDALKILSTQEFFISEERIMSIIRENLDLMDELMAQPQPKPKRRAKTPRLTAAQLRLFTDEP